MLALLLRILRWKPFLFRFSSGRSLPEKLLRNSYVAWLSFTVGMTVTSVTLVATLAL